MKNLSFYLIVGLALTGGVLAFANPFDLPLVYAQVNNDLIITSNSTWTNTYDPITRQGTLEIVQPRIMVDGEWKKYALDIQSDKIIYRTEVKGGMIYDIPTCSYSVYDYGYDGKVIIPSVSVLAIEQINDQWQHMAVNEESCNVEVIEDLENNEIQIISIKENTNEKFETDIILNGGGIKETWKVTSNSQNQLGITQTAHVGSEIRIGEQVIPIAEYSGQSFDRQFLEDNQVQIFEIADRIGYEFQDAFDSLRNINIIQDGETYKVNLDYSDGNFVGYLQIDPTLNQSYSNAYGSYGYGTGGNSGTHYCGSYNTFKAPNDGVGVGGGDCFFNGYNHNFPALGQVTVTSATQTLTWAGLQPSSWSNIMAQTRIESGQFSGYSTTYYKSRDLAGTNVRDFWAKGDTATASVSSSALTLIENQLVNGGWTSTYLTLNNSYSNPYPSSSTVYGGKFYDPIYTINYTQPPPDDPTGLTITQDTAGELDLSWTQTGTVTGFKIERSLDNSSWTTLTSNTGTTATTYTDTSLSANTLYYYRVFAYDSATSQYSTNSTSSSQTTWDYPEQVTGLTVTDGVPISLSWNEPASDVTITSYKIYRDTVFLKTVSATGTTTTDSPSTYGVSYSYTVSAVSSVGEGAQSTSASGVYGTPPNPPTSVTTSITSPNTNPLDVLVSYSSPTYVGSGTLTGFEIVRDGSVVGTVGLVTSYTDTVPSAGTYDYVVRAIATHGTSSDSNTSNITTPTTADPPTLSLAINNPNPNPFDITVSITPPANNGGSAVTGYNIYSSPDDTTYTLESSNVTTAQTITVSGQGTWYFKAESISPAGTGSLSTAFSIATPTEPSAINNLSATVNTDTQVSLTWSSPSNGGSSVTGFIVHQDGVQIATPTSTSYTVTGLTTDTSYTFTVYAVNNVGTSLVSNSETVTTYLSVTGQIDIINTTVQGATAKIEFLANVTSGTPTPTFSNYIIKQGSTTLASGITSPYYFKITNPNLLNYTISSTATTHWNTPTISGSTSIQPDYTPNWENGVSYNIVRTSNNLDLFVNRDLQTNWNLTCNYVTTAQILADETGVNGTITSDWYFDDSQAIGDTNTVYIECVDDGVTVLSLTEYNTNRIGGGIALLDNIFSEWTGTPVALFFVLLVAGLFSGRSAPAGILLVLAIVGVLGFIGLLVIDELIWAFILLAGILGIFMGKRFL